MASFVGSSHGAVSMIRPHVSTIFCHVRGMLRTWFSDEANASVVLQCMMKGSYRQWFRVHSNRTQFREMGSYGSLAFPTGITRPPFFQGWHSATFNVVWSLNPLPMSCPGCRMWEFCSVPGPSRTVGRGSRREWRASPLWNNDEECVELHSWVLKWQVWPLLSDKKGNTLTHGNTIFGAEDVHISPSFLVSGLSSELVQQSMEERPSIDPWIKTSWCWNCCA